MPSDEWREKLGREVAPFFYGDSPPGESTWDMLDDNERADCVAIAAAVAALERERIAGMLDEWANDPRTFTGSGMHFREAARRVREGA